MRTRARTMPMTRAVVFQSILGLERGRIYRFWFGRTAQRPRLVGPVIFPGSRILLQGGGLGVEDGRAVPSAKVALVWVGWCRTGHAVDRVHPPRALLAGATVFREDGRGGPLARTAFLAA